MFAPWPVNILVIGDSYSENVAFEEWVTPFTDNFPNLTVVNAATSGKCLWDTAGILGADTIVASIAADLAANPDADFVCWATCAGNDLLLLKQGTGTATLGDLQGAATTVLEAIAAADKRAIIMACVFSQAFIFGFGAGTEPQALAAQALRESFYAWMYEYCAENGHLFFDAKWAYEYQGVTAVSNNGIYGQYYRDGTHLNMNGYNVLANDFAARLKAWPYRKAAA